MREHTPEPQLLPEPSRTEILQKLPELTNEDIHGTPHVIQLQDIKAIFAHGHRHLVQALLVVI